MSSPIDYPVGLNANELSDMLDSIINQRGRFFNFLVFAMLVAILVLVAIHYKRFETFKDNNSFTD